MAFPVKTALFCALLTLGGCGNTFQPFAGIASGKNKSYYAPVEAVVYTYESVYGGSVNGGCIPGTSGVNLDQVGKVRYGGGSTCGGTALPATWYPGMTVRVHWRLNAYSDWRTQYLPPHTDLDPAQGRIIASYVENYTAEVPLPPPPPFAGNDFGKVRNITVHFLACNQLYISYGTNEENYGKEYVKRDFDLFKKSQKLCTPHPVVRSMADYRKHKAKMDAVRKEWAQIPQVILPEYMETLKKEGRLPVSGN